MFKYIKDYRTMCCHIEEYQELHQPHIYDVTERNLNYIFHLIYPPIGLDKI